MTPLLFTVFVVTLPVDVKLPLTDLPPAKLLPAPPSVRYTIGTSSKECQAFFDQGLTFLYGHKWPEAAQSFETATRYDTKCPMAWWALSRALDGWGNAKQKDALKKAQELLSRAGDRERLLITARLQDKGLTFGGKKAAARTIDELLTLYDDDEEAWFNRASYADNDRQRVAFWRTLLRLNPAHSGARFELARFQEIDRGAEVLHHCDEGTEKCDPPFVGPPAPKKETKPAKDGKMPLSGLTPSKIAPNLCVYRYRITTGSPQCQAFFDQGLDYLYSYVYMEAARSFETALQHDPECPMAWWGLSRALDKWSHGNQSQALTQAQHLLHRAGVRERLLIIARLQEKGLFPGVTPDKRKTAAASTLDEMLSVYDDTEAWFARAELSDGNVDRVAYFKALLRLDPLHPGANHELVHFFETYRRPVLGWIYAENYIRSSPGIPHAFHMQSHLAMRIGKWDKCSDRSARAVELEKAYHNTMHVKPADDTQYVHHLETLARSLIHDGRFHEARAVKKELTDLGQKSQNALWFRLHLAERDYAEVDKLVEHYRKSDKAMACYCAALAWLQRGETAKAAAEVEALRKFGGRPGGRYGDNRFAEVQGLLKCQQGESEAGPALLAKAVERTKNDYSHHAWGEGATYMESWGVGALTCGRRDAAEEAFLEALAHDPGSVLGALGLQVLCERMKRDDEAERYARLARQCWKKADAGALDKVLADLRQCHALELVGPPAPR